MNSTSQRRSSKDVIIIGGGLAGLSLARQLKLSQAELEILVVEKNTFPVPEKTAKVGESTVEIGSRYFETTLKLENHFKQRHLRKHGLRCFFGSPQNDFSQQDELGVSELFGLPTYQIDRGALENYLFEQVVEDGVLVRHGATISGLSVQQSEKSVTVHCPNGQQRYQSPWIVDAAGRQSLLKNQLNLQQSNPHNGNAVWFRVDRQIKLDSWSDDPQWRDRIIDKDTRWLSTNHLMGPGYWVWIIPLDNGATSIGVVMDDEVFESNDFSNFDATFNWLEDSHARCAQAIDGADVLDYVVIRDYALSCKQMFSDQGWGLSGESGVFADPFYSPGSDFIAFNNSFINHLIVDDFAGKDIRLNSRLFQNISQSFFESTLSLYTGQYGGFGDRRLMSLKLVWDYSYYWGVLSLLFFKSAMVDGPLMRQLNPLLRRAQDLNARVQTSFRQRAVQRKVLSAQGLFMNQFDVPCLKHFTHVLDNSGVIDTQDALSENIELLTRLAFYTEQMLDDNATVTISDDERSLLADYRHSVLA